MDFHTSSGARRSSAKSKFVSSMSGHNRQYVLFITLLEPCFEGLLGRVVNEQNLDLWW